MRQVTSLLFVKVTTEKNIIKEHRRWNANIKKYLRKKICEGGRNFSPRFSRIKKLVIQFLAVAKLYKAFQIFLGCISFSLRFVASEKIFPVCVRF